ncbi:MAG TPA: hypothetical protein VGE52_06845 [Pirellulales bacterium]
MNTFHGTYEVSLDDVGLAYSLARSVCTQVASRTVGEWPLAVNGRVLSGEGGCEIDAWGTATQLDELVAKLNAATVPFKERRLPYRPQR